MSADELTAHITGQRRQVVGAAAADTKWTVTVADRPSSINAERAGHRGKRMQQTRLWRDYGIAAAAMLKRGGARRHDGRFTVTTTMSYVDGRGWFDVGNWLPGPKALVDGLVNAGLLVDDGPRWCRELRFVHGGKTGETLCTVEIDLITETDMKEAV